MLQQEKRTGRKEEGEKENGREREKYREALGGEYVN